MTQDEQVRDYENKWTSIIYLLVKHIFFTILRTIILFDLIAN